MARTAGGRCGSTASTWASGTGPTRRVARAAERPLRSPLTRSNAPCTPSGSSSSSTAQANMRLTRPTSLLTVRRARPTRTTLRSNATAPVTGSTVLTRRVTSWRTMALRTALSFLGVNSAAGRSG